MILIKNAQVFAPKALGKKDVLLAYDKILEIADCIEPWRDDLTVIDAAGKMLVPGFIDQHVHIVGGGEGGFDTRTPEFQLSKAVTSGVTTLVGLLGTDGYTKSPELLLAKTKALNNEGICKCRGSLLPLQRMRHRVLAVRTTKCWTSCVLKAR